MLDKSDLELFYQISTMWTARDQRYQAVIGFEYDLCRKSFEQLLHLAGSETNADATHWKLDEDRAAVGAIMARAFVDHATTVQKLVKGYSTTGWLGALARSFYEENQALFDLRNTFQHSYERIDEDPGPNDLQPLCGDLSWSELTDRPSLDLYVVSYGPMVGGQFASPAIDMQGFKRLGLNHIFIRAHETELDAIQAFQNLTALVKRVHEGLSDKLAEVHSNAGITRGSEMDVRLPSQMSIRMRLEGIELNLDPEADGNA